MSINEKMMPNRKKRLVSWESENIFVFLPRFRLDCRNVPAWGHTAAVKTEQTEYTHYINKIHIILNNLY